MQGKFESSRARQSGASGPAGIVGRSLHRRPRSLLVVAGLLACAACAPAPDAQAPAVNANTPAVQATPGTPESPRLAELLTQWKALHTRVPAEADALVERFWKEVSAQGGTPLVEPAELKQGYFDPDDKAGHRVTFLWDARRHPAEQVVAMGGEVLAPLGDTGIRYLSRVLPAKSWFSYDVTVGPSVDPKNHDEFSKWFDNNSSVADPLNPRAWPDLTDEATRRRLEAVPAGRPASVMSVLELPGAQRGPGLAPVAELGQWQRDHIRSKALDNERDVFLYRPAGLPPATPQQPYRVLVVFDGEDWDTQFAVANALDALVTGRRIQPTVAVLVSNVARSGELPPNPDFARFVGEELLPWVSRQVKGASTRPEHVVATGFSYGGLAAVWLGYRIPQHVGNVISSSGSFWWTPPKDSPLRTGIEDAAGPGDDWLTRQFVAAARKPVRFYLAAGLLELPEDGTAGIIDNNRRLRDVLLAKGYEVHYRENMGDHDHLGWVDTMERGLQQLLSADPRP